MDSTTPPVSSATVTAASAAAAAAAAASATPDVPLPRRSEIYEDNLSGQDHRNRQGNLGYANSFASPSEEPKMTLLISADGAVPAAAAASSSVMSAAAEKSVPPRKHRKNYEDVTSSEEDQQVDDRKPAAIVTVPSAVGAPPAVGAPLNVDGPPFIANSLTIANLPAAVDPTSNDPHTVDKETKLHIHEELFSKLIGRGAVEGVLDASKDQAVQQLEIGAVVHDSPDKVLEFILGDASKGVFRRKTLAEYRDGDETHRVVFWQLFLNGKCVEFVMNLSVSTSIDLGTHTIEFTSFEVTILPDKIYFDMKSEQSSSSRIVRANLNAKLQVSNCTYGQAILTFICTVAVKENKKGDLDAASKSVENILEEIEKHFSQPDVIDKRRKRHFIEEVMPNAPDLTRKEEGMLRRLGNLQATLQEKGERVKGTLKEDVDKFLWREEGKVWGAYSVTVDLSAKSVLAEQFELDTYERSTKHRKKKHGDRLARGILKDVDGNRSIYYRLGVHITGLENRLFDNWFTWKEITSSNGRSGNSFIVGFVPLSAGRIFEDGEGVLGETTGIYIITEIAPNVCRVIRIQTVDLKSNLIPTAVVEY